MKFILHSIFLLGLGMFSIACSDFNAKRAGYSTLQHAACQREQEKALHPPTESCANNNYERDYERYQQAREAAIND